MAAAAEEGEEATAVVAPYNRRGGEDREGECMCVGVDIEVLSEGGGKERLAEEDYEEVSSLVPSRPIRRSAPYVVVRSLCSSSSLSLQ